MTHSWAWCSPHRCLRQRGLRPGCGPEGGLGWCQLGWQLPAAAAVAGWQLTNGLCPACHASAAPWSAPTPTASAPDLWLGPALHALP
ncbi:hypothetical protein HaLaN_04542, partial [Haematococcus lacustris]